MTGNIQNQENNFKNIGAQAFNGNIKANGNISMQRPVYSVQLGLGLSNVNPSLLLNKKIFVFHHASLSNDMLNCA